MKKLIWVLVPLVVILFKSQQIGRSPFYNNPDFWVDTNAPPSDYYALYDFGDGTPEGVQTYRFSWTDVVEDGYACRRFISSSSDPLLVIVHDSLFISQARYIKLRAKVQTTSWEGIRRFSPWATPAYSWVYPDDFDTLPNMEWAIMTIDNSLLDGWTAWTYRCGWRLDFFSASGDTIYIDWITVYENP